MTATTFPGVTGMLLADYEEQNRRTTTPRTIIGVAASRRNLTVHVARRDDPNTSLCGVAIVRPNWFWKTAIGHDATPADIDCQRCVTCRAERAEALNPTTP